MCSPLSYYNTALSDLRKCLTKIGVDPSGYSEHSGRRGGTTAAAAAGAPIGELMLQGRLHNQETPHVYIENAIKGSSIRQYNVPSFWAEFFAV